MIEVKSDLKVIQSLILEDGRIISCNDMVKFLDVKTGEVVEATVRGLKAKSSRMPKDMLKYVAEDTPHKLQEISFEDLDDLEIIESVVKNNSNLK